MDTPFYDHLSAKDFENVYEPAEDSFLLLDALEADLENLSKQQPLVCLEIGSGSGIIITALSKKLKCTLCLASDINPFACTATKSTAKHNNAVWLEAINCNLADALRPNSVDVLIFNPPYVVTPDDELTFKNSETTNTPNKNLEYSWAGGECGRRIIDKLLINLNDILTDSGVFYLLLLQENKPAEIRKILEESNFKSEILLQRHIPGERLSVLKITKINGS